MYDTHPDHVRRCVEEFSAEALAADRVYTTPCDVFAPCALGAVINDTTIPQLDTKIIAGCANNQLAEERHAEMLKHGEFFIAPIM